MSSINQQIAIPRDEVLEYANLAGFPATGEAGKIYVALDTNKTYRWSGTAYVYITSGAVDSVAGKTGVVTLVKGDVGLGNVDNTSDANKPVSTAQQTALNLKANLVSPALTGTPTAPTAAVGTSTTQIATTGFVNAEIANWVPNFSDINSKPTTLSGYGITDALSTSGNEVLPLVNALVTSASLTTSTTTTNQVVDSFSSNIYRTAKYLIQANFGTSYHSSEALMIHDGTTASLVVYGDVMTGSSLMTLDADVSDGNVRLLATPLNAATTIKVVRTSIDG